MNDDIISEGEWKRNHEREMREAAEEERNYLQRPKYTADGYPDPNEHGLSYNEIKARRALIEAHLKSK